MSDTAARWMEAQAIEWAWWQRTPAREAEIRQGHAWLRGLLDLSPATVAGASVTDLGGGAWPIVGDADLPLGRRIVVDPLVVPGWPAQDVTRVVSAAEDYSGPCTEEVWGYNVLQHVRDPEAVIRVALAHAERTIRWFEYVGTPIEAHHPHSIDAHWLRGAFEGFRVVRDVAGVDGHAWVALVLERT